MRDDIHKNAPVPHHWRQYMRICRKEATWKGQGSSRALRAVRSTARDEFNPNFAKSLQDAIDSWQSGLFKDQDHLPFILDGVSSSFLLRAGDRRLTELLEVQAEPDVRAAVQNALEERIDSYEREGEAFLRERSSSSEVKELCTRQKETLQEIDLAPLVDSIVRGEPIRVGTLEKENLGLEDDLL